MMQGGNLNSSCILCTDPDDGNMVTCSKCLGSYHYTCGNIHDSVEFFTWICQNCSVQQQYISEPNLIQLGSRQEMNATATQPADPLTRRRDTANSNAAQSSSLHLNISAEKQLQLQQLEEEMQLRKEYLQRKYDLLRSNNESQSILHCGQITNAWPVAGNNNNCSSSQSMQNCYQTVSINRMQNNSQNINPQSRGNCQQTNMSQSPNIINNDSHRHCEYSTQTIPNIPTPQCHSTNINRANMTFVNDRPLNIPHTNNQNNFAAAYQNTNLFTNENITSNNFNNITTTQLVARQSISRDLPAFNGDPKEWAIFISAFEQSTRVAGYSNEENLIRLQKCLHGKAREAVRNCLILPDMVPDIIRTLKMYFGRPECVLTNLINEVRKLSLQRGKLESLVEFAFAVKNICATIRASKLEDYLTNPTLLQELVDKLPTDTLLQWAMFSKDIARPNLLDLSDWLYGIAEATCRVTIPVFDSTNKSSKQGRLNTHTNSAQQKPPYQCVICNEDHKIAQCSKFLDMTVTERWDIVKSKNLCRMCLGKHRRRCWFQKPCGENGCIVNHNSLLHNNEQPSGSTESILNSHKSIDESFFRIVPVTLYNDKKSVSIYALMDDGSSLTLLEKEVADVLQVCGIRDPLCIRWTGDISRYENNSQRLNLEISSTKPNSKIFPINNVYTVQNLNLSAEHMIVEKIKEKYPYLKNIPLEGYHNVVPSMIIGVNNPNLITPTQICEGGWQQPVACKTRLGWTLFGGGNSNIGGKLNYHKCVCRNDDEIHNIIKQYFSDENLGILPPTKDIFSKDDQQALDILEKTCKFIDGRYEVGLLWKHDQPDLPNSFQTAINRLQCIQKKAKKDPVLAENLKNQILNLQQKEYAVRLPNCDLKESGGKIWYLPTFIVKNPHKPDKIRLVWDAAAKSGNYALNDFLTKGPDLLVPLINILFKFRMGPIAICGDIAEMFHRIKVRKEDACSQRFLWWDEDGSLLVYQLNVLTFGASCSPCISHYVRNLNAEKFARNQKVIDAITKQHYVDDFIDSANTVEEAIELALNVREVHAKGGFCMRNWSSNSAEVLSALGESKNFVNRTFECNEYSSQWEKILGLYWDPKSDVFKMNLKFVRLKRPILNSEIIPTKREVLQVLMSVFDPLGFVACFMSYLKVILQEIWRSGINWDQHLNEELYKKWKNWLKYLPTITAVSIPRCYSLALQQNFIAELHTFVDASEDAYAAVSYFRIEYAGKVEIKFIAAKSKVAPLRPISVPRLELQAAVIGTRLMRTVSCHNLKLKRKLMWTDSKTVLNWFKGDPRKYKQFVMFRVAEILKYTNASDWRWVPSTMNVADYATKFRPPNDNYKDWFNGPSWLEKSENEWPGNLDPVDEETVDELISEIRPRHLNIHTRKSNIISFNYLYFSSWFRLYRAVGNWLLYMDRCYQKAKKLQIENSLIVSHLNRAKNIIYKIVQMSAFPDEYFAVKFGKEIPKGGVCYKLNIYIDNNGIIKVKNRAQYATSACGLQRDLIILPGNHHITKLIIINYHLAFHHSNNETVLNEIRQVYFIIKLRVAYKDVRKNCQWCKNELAKPIPPQMAPVPPARLGAFQRPFTYVGTDYFGPIAVTFGRKSLKRWGVIFTCLTIRAIHIEIAHSLSTDSFLMCLRNFIARRGSPAEIFSDNGTNFRGADRFLRDELKNINFNEVQSNLAYKGISWRFNPPAAPHMGGAWERLIRSIKNILYKICPTQKFTDESLRSSLMEVEMIVNSRPLTYVSIDCADQEAITPNHFILGSSNGTKPFCELGDIDYRMCLRQSEIFANAFWRRWVKEMLPTFTRRSKWSQRVKPIEVDDIVLIVDENSKRNTWTKGKIVEVIKARDGQVRRAKVKTINGVVERPAVKLAVLDVDNRVE
uniref:Polyprotein n=1 Tax=Calliphora vicina TaxID=7373 RepID=A0A0K3CPX7_CALVI|nr:polyprotein [Calliphora vicina]